MKTEKEKRIEQEKRIIRRLINRLKQHGWVVTGFYDGEDYTKWSSPPSTEKVMDEVFSVDSSWLRFSRLSGPGFDHEVLIALGNGEDCIVDYSMAADDADGFAAIVDSIPTD